MQKETKGVLGEFIKNFDPNNNKFKRTKRKMILQSYWFNIVDFFNKLSKMKK